SQRKVIDQRRPIDILEHGIDDLDAQRQVRDRIKHPLQLWRHRYIGLRKAMRSNAGKVRGNTYLQMVQREFVERQSVGIEDCVISEDGAQVVNSRDLDSIQIDGRLFQ